MEMTGLVIWLIFMPGNPHCRYLDGVCPSGIAMRLSTMRFAIHGMDYERHGKSAGLLGCTNGMEDDDTYCADYFIF
ncbi:uncharacterized protein LOC120016347 isoform X2 [Tripterygium wilfordii]|uniref:uncharacterized protein LOC120016347 isoform X2 n=1 Tax=Tripterygium wilfordii TaxID=458696 RepID=UPI0018F83EC0|nr:uncharacterized protein LOC120016347 isoform X2 [Tripterygium wilfordii]